MKTLSKFKTTYKNKNITDSMQDVFENFLIEKKTDGIAPETIRTYEFHLAAISHRLDTEMPIGSITERDLQKMVVAMQRDNLSPQSIRSYTRTLKSFFSWCNEKGYTNLNIQLYKAEEAIKETYTDEELQKLLKKPNVRNCTFAEMRSWAIVNLLVNSGPRSSTIRNIKNRDVDFENNVITVRHSKSKKVQLIPMSDMLTAVIKEFAGYRKGSPDDYLFCTEYGCQMTKDGFHTSIVRYNEKRGVKLHSIHAFRHTMARMFILDLGGNALMLQKILGHSTMEMTKHYVKIFDKDLLNTRNAISPLENMKKSLKSEPKMR